MPNSTCAGVCWTLRNTEVTTKGNDNSTEQPCVTYKHVCLYISVHANASKKCAIQKQCMHPACKFMHASRMQQNECKLCAHACKQMLTCNLQPFAYMHLGQILTCACKQKITCKIRVLACMQHVYNFCKGIYQKCWLAETSDNALHGKEVWPCNTKCLLA